MRNDFRKRSNSPRINNVRQGKPQAEPPKEEKPVCKVTLSFEDIKQQLAAWAENERIPGKFQAWFTADANPEHADWRILKTYRGKQESLTIEAPARDMEAPELVTRVFQQLKKEHLHIFSKALRQIWFRAIGDGRYAMLVQVNLKGRFSAHGYKTFIDFVQRNCPEVISCHHIQCMPDLPFDPAGTTPMKVEAKSAFGSDFMPIGETGISMHVLDWTPRIRDAWMNLPKRIEDAIHPNSEDCFFEFYSGSSFVSASLSSKFKRVVSMDCREYAMMSSRLNARNTVDDNMKFVRSHVEQEFFPKFFGKPENEGRWTFYFNLPGDEPLAQGVAQAVAFSRPERILLQTSNLEVAARTIRQFRNEGYMLRKNIPLYLEPGSGKFEVMFLFVPDRVGILGQNPAQKQRSRTIQRPKERVSAQKTQEIPHFSQKAPTFKQRKG
ncbi:hypothetical protein [uncultured Fibrobacter sp.]|uniref:hypothetical protein n=1 Tax=uncultured Fibrobacter sp. TaxID=261512 RepID=UPI002625C756|nr:hypothetical protein [uncultured Fibrobacter sp.]